MNKELFISVLLFSIASVQLVFTQDYRSIFTEKYSISKDSAEVYCKQLMSSPKANLRAFGFATKGYILSTQGDYTKAHNNFGKSFTELNSISNDKQLLEEKLYVLEYYARLLLAEHKIEQADISINEGIQLAKELDNAIMLIKFNNLLGRSFSILGLDQKAIENGKYTIDQIKVLKDKFSGSTYNSTLFNAYLNTAHRCINSFLRDTVNNKTYIDTTKIYIGQVKEFVTTKNIKLNVNQERRLLNLSADIFFHTQKYDKAIEAYTRTLKIVRASGLKKRIYQIKYRIAESYFFLEDYAKAKTLFDELDKSAIDTYELLKNSIRIKYYYAMIYQEYGKPDLALKYTDTFNDQIEDYYKKMSNLKIDVFTENELRSKNEAIQNLREDLSNEKTANTELTNYLLVSIAIIVIGVFAAVLINKNQKYRYKQNINHLNSYIENLKSNQDVSITSKVTEEKANTILSKLRAIESQHLFIDTDYSLNKVAKKIGSNSAYVSQVVNEYWDKSFVQYTNELRINYILLKLNEDEIYQKFTLLAIAESAGYKSLSSFNKHFKLITGVSPKQYLKHLKTNVSHKKTV
ncbi:helix-turn-helix domain-containing protein [Winogradskyella sp.]|uniref:helix-turn-helix domain-containing protein n=1 Tax=Winogradskyella sp. TaxID=1883156 RepID=UPI003BAA30EB